MSEHHSTRRAKVLKQDSARQQKRRDKLKKAGVPTTHVVNRAVAEGLFYYLDAERAMGTSPNDAIISVKDVLVYATAVLSRHTNGTDQYDANGVHKTILARIGKVSASKFRLSPAWSALASDDD